MNRPSCILFLSDTGRWQLATVRGGKVDLVMPESPSADSALALLYRRMTQAGYRGEGICLGIPSAWCLAAAVKIDDLPARNRRPLMLYRFEEELPVAAEEVVIDFAPGAIDALGVAVRWDRVAPVVDELAAAGIAVSHIIPEALLAAQRVLTDFPDTQVLLCGQGEAVDVVGLREGTITCWHSLPAVEADLLQELRWHAHESGSGRQVIACGLSESLIAILQSAYGVIAVRGLDQLTTQVAALQADAILRGKATSWVDLRRDWLAPLDPLRPVRGLLNCAAAALLIFGISFALAMGWRAYRFQSVAAIAAKQQAAVFAQAFPGKPLPANIKSRLASEQKKLLGERGLSGNSIQNQSALDLMYRTLSALPRDLRYRLVDVRFTGDRLYLEGEARSHGEADQLASSLRGVPGLVVDPPQSEQRADSSIGFSLSAALKSAASTGRTTP